MAINTATPVRDGNDIWGQENVRTLDYLVQDAYVTDGYVIRATDFGLKYFNNLIVGSIAGTGLGTYLVVPSMNNTTGIPSTTAKLLLFTALGTQVSNGVSPTAFTVRLLAYGR